MLALKIVVRIFQLRSTYVSFPIPALYPVVTLTKSWRPCSLIRPRILVQVAIFSFQDYFGMSFRIPFLSSCIYIYESALWISSSAQLNDARRLHLVGATRRSRLAEQHPEHYLATSYQFSRPVALNSAVTGCAYIVRSTKLANQVNCVTARCQATLSHTPAQANKTPIAVACSSSQ
ncbi:hypothetical protein EV356DRAFT_3567 [Viridothelium virens]|uniref:Uncharacterized protein n=1 Tax=Viridothelium virens TaxID=1048519 RepID=A0A6A6HP64_VIRVR|nr:hypothetical protein EV356DRAFT_3567 [Viridothelium virens]